MTQFIDKSIIVAEIERRKNQFVSQAESFRKIGMKDKESYYAALASNMNSLSCFIDSLDDKCDGCNNIKGCITCENGSEWAHYEEPELQFKVGDTIRSKVWESAVHEIVFMDDSAYFFENGYMVRFADQEQWELAEEPVSEDLEEAAMQYAKSKHEDAVLQQIVSWDFKAGAQWQKQQMIDKACVWLSNVCIEDMTYKYDDFDTSEGWYKFIEDFKKYMEE